MQVVIEDAEELKRQEIIEEEVGGAWSLHGACMGLVSGSHRTCMGVAWGSDQWRFANYMGLTWG